MEEAIHRTVSELETHHSLSDPNSQTPISKSTLLDLQTPLDNALNTTDSIDIERLHDELSSKNLSPSSLLRPISSSMDSSPTHLALLASKVYLSVLLSPNSPVFTLFTPMAFLSLLRSIRRYFKNPNSAPSSAEKRTRKKKGGGKAAPSRNRARNVEDDECGSEENQFDVRVFFSVLERLELVLGLVHLDRFPDSLKSLTFFHILLQLLQSRATSDLQITNSDFGQPLVITVDENETVLNDTPDKIGIEAVKVSNYWEAIGVIAAHKAGIDPNALRRNKISNIQCISPFLLMGLLVSSADYLFD
ncbi:hypothetical protein LOK49_LG07G01858 [Camellia lanceoleosa]|uniref:Uncharacterized protein n=1 Tax=Camellia lanceoleosa TaxID=1840588 RepID=A0ACC0H1J6_9ERIC|nr:hypothetical protein LOK49_LG07G01858 [Camellia lanceoleosa]